MSGRYDSLSSPRRTAGAETRRAVPWGLFVVTVAGVVISLALAWLLPARQLQLLERSLTPDTSTRATDS